MPTYEYKCLQCDKSINLKREIDDRDEPVKCSCGNLCKRLYFSTNVVFKGGGFYSTDKNDK